MTISTILGFRGATTTTASPSTSYGLGHNAQHRGDIWIHSDGWKGGKKGDGAALSALTLLAFLFFLNILQSCLQDMSNYNQPTFVMATGGARREEVPAMVAVPVETPMPAGGMPPMMTPMMTPTRIKRQATPAPQDPEALRDDRARRAKREPTPSSEEQARHLQRVRQQQERRGEAGKAREAGWEMVSIAGNVKHRYTPPSGSATQSHRPDLVEIGLTPRHTSTASPLGATLEEAADDRTVFITPPPAGTRPASAPASAESSEMAMVRLSSSSMEGVVSAEGSSAANGEASTSTEHAANKQEEYDLKSVSAGGATTERIETATLPMAVPVAMLPLRPAGTVVTFVPLATTMRGVFNMLAGPLLRMVQPVQPVQPSPAPGLGTALSSGLGQRLREGLREGLRAAMCCDLVVCEAHRLGTIGGTIGERVATTVSSVVRWACGEESGELKAAAIRGRDGDGDGCRQHIEQCERRAGRRTAVTTIAALIEAYIIRRP